VNRTDQTTFKSLFPHVIGIDQAAKDDAWYWLTTQSLDSWAYSWFTLSSVGFRDKQTAMEFKLRFG
jgi:hypothetical protein